MNQPRLGIDPEQYMPLAEQIVSWRQQLDRPLVQGVVGGQGTGKTTLCRILVALLGSLGYRALAVSLDDFYKTYAARQADRRFIWRGPPGTHDLDLAIAALDQLRSGQSAAIPHFDKSAHQGMGDRTGWITTQSADIVLFEGWFVGVRPVPETAFDQPPDPINTEADRQFALTVNQELNAYLPLWERLDRLILLQPQDYHWSKPWRAQAETALGQSGMTPDQVNQFVTYFWQAIHPELFIPPLIEDGIDLVLTIGAEHQLISSQRLSSD
jgi:D-glycerate 3-kinase